jgi:hypothetical protein
MTWSNSVHSSYAEVVSARVVSLTNSQNSQIVGKKSIQILNTVVQIKMDFWAKTKEIPRFKIVPMRMIIMVS